ncbi:hypothetical protein, partial [Candidatus Magnetaquicoccus inordinatus]|uniref:hypothetical protein n=1 Tax=Candidatus Magnetaquicoccus inordinatus TaxID=2496818 RepID=UPI00187D1599
KKREKKAKQPNHSDRDSSGSGDGPTEGKSAIETAETIEQTGKINEMADETETLQAKDHLDKARETVGEESDVKPSGKRPV